MQSRLTTKLSKKNAHVYFLCQFFHIELAFFVYLCAVFGNKAIPKGQKN